VKHLRITYGDQVLYEGVPGKVAWCETEGGIVEVRAEPAPQGKVQGLDRLAEVAKQFNGKPLYNGKPQPLVERAPAPVEKPNGVVTPADTAGIVTDP
jgi:hypothetical protein